MDLIIGIHEIRDQKEVFVNFNLINQMVHTLGNDKSNTRN